MNTVREVRAVIGHDDCSVHEPCSAPSGRDCPLEPARQRRREAKQGEWSQLVVKREPGGLRHYLDGQPVHCGAGLELQSWEDKSDDYGEYTKVLQVGVSVRYEASFFTKVEWSLHHYTGGHEFIAQGEAWHRFRWPKERR